MSGLQAAITVRREGFILEVDLEIQAGETVALLGPNGSGKSTLVEAIAGIVAVDQGEITIADRPVDRRRPGGKANDVFVPPEGRGVGVVFQDYLLFEHLSVAANIGFGPRSSGKPTAMVEEVTKHWLAALDLEPLRDRYPSELSGGQAQRVALARALATEPALLLLDEPLAAVDIATRAALRRTLITHLDQFERPTLFVTHEPTDAFLLADTIYIMENGVITQKGSAADIRQRPATDYVAAIAGLNFFAGTNHAGELALTGHRQQLVCADTATNGPVLVTISPTAVAIHHDQPHGSPRNSWQATVETIEHLGDVVRVTLGGPLPISADITPAAAEALGLRPGSSVWAAVKATEIVARPG